MVTFARLPFYVPENWEAAVNPEEYTIRTEMERVTSRVGLTWGGRGLCCWMLIGGTHQQSSVLPFILHDATTYWIQIYFENDTKGLKLGYLERFSW